MNECSDASETDDCEGWQLHYIYSELKNLMNILCLELLGLSNVQEVAHHSNIMIIINFIYIKAFGIIKEIICKKVHTVLTSYNFCTV